MEKSIKITLIIVAGVIILGAMAFNLFSSANPSNTISVTGQATIKAIPDLATVYFNVKTIEATSSEAKNENSRIVEAVRNALILKGFESEDIQTLDYSINENYEWSNGKSVRNGYLAMHSIRLEMPSEESDKIGTAIDAGVDAGAQISSINFELSQVKQNEYKAESMKLAAEDAKVKADAVAQGLGKKTGAIVSVSINEFGYYPWREFSASGSADVELAKETATKIQPSERDISSSVNAVFKLK